MSNSRFCSLKIPPRVTLGFVSVFTLISVRPSLSTLALSFSVHITTRAHKTQRCCSTGRTVRFPLLLHSQLKATKYFVCPKLPHYLAEEYIQVTNNILPWMRDLHSANLPIATTEPITSHNECLQVVKLSAIAKHWTEWSDYTMETQPYPREYNKVETLSAVQDNIYAHYKVYFFQQQLN